MSHSTGAEQAESPDTRHRPNNTEQGNAGFAVHTLRCNSGIHLTTFLALVFAAANADDEHRPRSEILVTTNLREYKFLVLHFLAPQLHFPSMTVRTPSAMNKHMHPSETSDADRYRSLERALANKYIQLVLARRRRLAANRGGLPEVMRPR